MLHLFVAPTPFEGWGEYPYDGTTLLLVIVSLGALTLTVCLALVMLLSGEPLAPLLIYASTFFKHGRPR